MLCLSRPRLSSFVFCRLKVSGLIWMMMTVNFRRFYHNSRNQILDGMNHREGVIVLQGVVLMSLLSKLVVLLN